MKLAGLRNPVARARSPVAGSVAAVRVTDHPDDLRAIRRLRYKVYIEEQKKPLPWADHATCELPDPLDPSGIHFIGTSSSGQTLSAARLHMDPQAVRETLGRMGVGEAVATAPARFAYVSKLVVLRSLRGAGLASSTISAAYNHGRDLGGQYCFLTCNPRLAPYYESIGMYQVGAARRDPFVGLQVPMILAVEDRANFERRRSFLAVDAARYANDEARAAEIIRHFQSHHAAAAVCLDAA